MKGPLYLLLFFSPGIMAQEKIVTGNVRNEATGEPIPFVHLILVGKTSGTTTDENGSFHWELSAAEADDTVRFSCVGFKSLELPISALNGAKVYMQPSVETLNEVEVYLIKGTRHAVINDFSGKRSVGLGNFSGGAYPSAVARYYEKPRKFSGNCFLESIQVRFYPAEGQRNLPALFRIRVLEADAGGKPGKDILAGNLVVKREPLRFSMEVDMLPHYIRIPENGFFVAVEHLFVRQNAYEELRSFRVSDTLVYRDIPVVKYAPVFKGVLEHKDKGSGAYYLGTGGWRKMDRLDTSDPAFGRRIPLPAFRLRITN
ncbi:carboxypeptidase-like regulatory domain-containing protein [Sinomicrobium soli]|uniref:carboxypeptidase-like regulatory domain-containing protein n=1 Tax=Sinomicrobium sp. N-1-3-6 TaxID=2219864 RepID=UPI000DCE5607|nr:carboxypeptidase-like regulatory domain-containing protein [Sinomicrobium sp. N-1-3-6]RAV27679.1 hypothetical protein DN748_17425 [Sinomicrobium sp. N-1-3-6]